ncbi:hypothetical protein AG1IA_08212 [Rhizoctonia solani AG-1 IA]|uniref:Uncharacterized protein n=1 Tax=Thanatephorus cucumeris (strain AG1-IA) TaxID=983506 RepID=L8WN30_THACA|nr:hypothetical protein AG1IA_08212 [Rhizoctonia solani AG-1 IA]
MSQYNINPRCLTSTLPPSMTGNPNFNGHSPFQASGSRPQSVVSSRSYPGIESALERTNNGNPRVDASSIIPVVHNYCAWMGNVMVEFIIRIVTPKDSRDSAVTLTCQAGGVERIMGEPQIVQLDTNPTQFRVWLSSPEFQVRLWAEDEFWIGAQLPFPSIPGAHLARLTHASPLFHTYHGTVGAASLVYTVWYHRPSSLCAHSG